eukprot:571532-Hanusia_phi.AAC.3
MMISSKVRRNGSVDSDQLRSNPLLKKWYGQIHKEKFTPQLQAMLLSKLKGSVRVKMECFDRSRRKDSDRTEQTDSKAKRDFDLNLKHTKAQNSSKEAGVLQNRVLTQVGETTLPRTFYTNPPFFSLSTPRTSTTPFHSTLHVNYHPSSPRRIKNQRLKNCSRPPVVISF